MHGVCHGGVIQAGKCDPRVHCATGWHEKVGTRALGLAVALPGAEDKIEDEMGFSEFENFIDDFYKSPIDIFKDIHLIRKLRKYSKITTDQLKKKRLKYHNKLVSILMENIDYMSNDIIELVLKIKKNLIAIHKIIYS